jgi:predicted GNAT superfamily acetyltransferase
MTQSSSAQRISKPHAPSRKPSKPAQIRLCHTLDQFERCVEVERQVWQSADIDVVPIPLFVVAAHTGGQVIGAFQGRRMVGFTMAIAGWRQGKPLLHSHMTAVLEPFRDQGIGRQLKLFQRAEALSRNISLIEWTFDPLITRNAHFNFMRLGAIARRYIPNAYGRTTSPLHANLPTDRLVAEWHLRSARVRRTIAGKREAPLARRESARILVPDDVDALKAHDPAAAGRIQTRLRRQFLARFASGFAATALARGSAGWEYILEADKQS